MAGVQSESDINNYFGVAGCVSPHHIPFSHILEKSVSNKFEIDYFFFVSKIKVKITKKRTVV